MKWSGEKIFVVMIPEEALIMENLLEKTFIQNSSCLSETELLCAAVDGLAISDLNNQNLEQKLTVLIAMVTEHLRADHGYILLKDQKALLANIAQSFRSDLQDRTVTISTAVADSIVQNNQAMIISDALNSQAFPMDPAIVRFNISTVIAAPVRCGEHTFGLIYADSTSPAPWNDNTLCSIRFMAGYIALALNCVYLKRQVEDNKKLAASGKAVLQLSHSVKNVLQMLTGASEVLDFGLRTNEIHRVKKSWDILKPNIERLRKFTMDMLDYSKERKLEPGPCDFNRVIQGAIESLNAQLKQKRSKLNIRTDPEMPIVELDTERIHEMALNLILNALDIVDDNSGIVSIETSYRPQSQLIALVVSDNGPGMTEEIKAKVFQPFESSRNKFGTGLGMAIAKQIINQHNGKIEFQTEVGKGTVFTVTLPAKILK